MPRQSKKEVSASISNQTPSVPAPVEASSAVESKPATKRGGAGKREAKKDLVSEAPVVASSTVASSISDSSADGASVDDVKKNKKLRHFRLITNEIDPDTKKIIAKGRYSGTKPKQAANKAYTAIIKKLTEENGGVVPLDTFTEFKIIESTRAKKPEAVSVAASASVEEGGASVAESSRQVKKANKKKNKNKGKSVYSYKGQRKKLTQQQAVTLRDKKKFLGYITVTKEKTDKLTGAVTIETKQKKDYAPLLEEKEVEENGVMVKKMVPKTVVYGYKNDVKKLKGEKNVIKADDVVEVEEEGEKGASDGKKKGKRSGATGEGSNGGKRAKAVAKEVKAKESKSKKPTSPAAVASSSSSSSPSSSVSTSTSDASASSTASASGSKSRKSKSSATSSESASASASTSSPSTGVSAGSSSTSNKGVKKTSSASSTSPATSTSTSSSTPSSSSKKTTGAGSRGRKSEVTPSATA
jgi:hypothetical protein